MHIAASWGPLCFSFVRMQLFVMFVDFLHKLGLFFFIFQQGGSCELQVTGKNGEVAVNKRKTGRDSKVPLIGGDEVVFGQCGKHAYVSIHYQILFIHHTCPFHSSVHSLLIWMLIGTSAMIQWVRFVSLTSYLEWSITCWQIFQHPLRGNEVTAGSAGENNQRVVGSGKITINYVWSVWIL